MKYERLEVRLDEDDVRKVAELKAAYRTSVSGVVRKAIDEAYEKVMVEKRLALVKRMAEANIEDVPDIDTLKRQLAEAHDPGIP
jgi:hypothetical protein